MKSLLLTTAIAASFLLTSTATADVAEGLKAREADQWEKALTEFDKALKNESTRFEANWRMGETLVMLGESKEALEYLEAAVEENPNHANAQYWWGAANGEMAGQASIFSAAGYAKACLKAFEKAVELDPNHLDAREGLMQYYLEAPGFMGGDPEKAVVQAREIMTRDKMRGYLSLAAVHNSSEEPEKAMQAYNDLLTEFPGNTNGLLMRGLAHRRAEDHTAAFADFEALASSDPNAEDNKMAAEERIMLGLYFMGAVSSNAKINIDKGIESLVAYLEYSEFDLPIRQSYGQYYLSTLYLEKGQVEEARTFMKKAQKGEKDKDLKKRLKRLKKKLKKA